MPFRMISNVTIESRSKTSFPNSAPPRNGNLKSKPITLMLRISTTETPDIPAVLKLEGQIVGAWTQELSDASEQILADGRHLTLDLLDVSLVDRSGFDLLASLSNRKVALVNCSPFLEEQLRQAAVNHSTPPTTLP